MYMPRSILALLLVLNATRVHAQWVQSGLPSDTVVSFAVNGTNLFIGTYSRGVFLFANDGASWTAVNTGLTNTYVNALAVSDTNLFAKTEGGGVFLSTNNGTSWTAVDSGMEYPYVYSLAVGGTEIFAGANGAVVYHSTNNGTSWTGGGTGLVNVSYIISLATSGSTIFAGALGCCYSSGLYHSLDGGSSWDGVNNGLTNSDVRSLAVKGNDLFAGTNGGGVFLTTDGGGSWTPVNNGLTNAYVRSLAVSGTNIFAGTGGGVYISADTGRTWFSVNGGLTNTDVRSLVVSGTNIFAGTIGGGVWRRPLSEMLGSVTMSLESGWDLLSVPVLVGDPRASKLFPTAISHAFAYDGGYVIKESLSVGTGYWLKFDSIMNQTISGVVIQLDTIPVKLGWNMIGSISHAVAINSLVSVPAGIIASNFFGYNGSSYFVADSIKPGSGYWVKVNSAGSLILSTSGNVTTTQSIRIIPDGETPPPPPTESITHTRPPPLFTLGQNYPNPFNPSTRINYELPTLSWVTLKIYDVLGQEVATLVNEMQVAGSKSAVWNSSNSPSGVYYYHLQAGTFSETKKLVLLK